MEDENCVNVNFIETHFYIQGFALGFNDNIVTHITDIAVCRKTC